MGIIVGMNSRTGGKSSGSSITYFPGENIEFDGTSIKVAITQSAGATYTEGSGVTIAQEDKPATGADLNALLLYIKELESKLAALNDHEARIAAIENAESFSTEDLSDADAAAIDYEDVF